MYPHGRILLAALTFSAAVGVLIASLGFIAAFWLSSLPPTDPPDNAPIRGVGIVIFAVAPAFAIASLGVVTPLTYVLWRWPRVRFGFIALACIAVATGITVYFGLPGSSFSAVSIIGAILSTVLVTAAYGWWRVLLRFRTSPYR